MLIDLGPAVLNGALTPRPACISFAALDCFNWVPIPVTRHAAMGGGGGQGGLNF